MLCVTLQHHTDKPDHSYGVLTFSNAAYTGTITLPNGADKKLCPNIRIQTTPRHQDAIPLITKLKDKDEPEIFACDFTNISTMPLDIITRAFRYARETLSDIRNLLLWTIPSQMEDGIEYQILHARILRQYIQRQWFLQDADPDKMHEFLEIINWLDPQYFRKYFKTWMDIPEIDGKQIDLQKLKEEILKFLTETYQNPAVILPLLTPSQQKCYLKEHQLDFFDIFS